MAKKSMIEREKKRLQLHTKYHLKRAKLLKQYQNYHETAQKLESVIVVGKQGVLVAFSVILVYHDMFLEKWVINVYYQVLQNQVGKNLIK
jgi:hypothetical protein